MKAVAWLFIAFTTHRVKSFWNTKHPRRPPTWELGVHPPPYISPDRLLISMPTHTWLSWRPWRTPGVILTGGGAYRRLGCRSYHTPTGSGTKPQLGESPQLQGANRKNYMAPSSPWGTAPRRRLGCFQFTSSECKVCPLWKCSKLIVL